MNLFNPSTLQQQQQVDVLVGCSLWSSTINTSNHELVTFLMGQQKIIKC